jgi:hypothetical protein
LYFVPQLAFTVIMGCGSSTAIESNVLQVQSKATPPSNSSNENSSKNIEPTTPYIQTSQNAAITSPPEKSDSTDHLDKISSSAKIASRRLTGFPGKNASKTDESMSNFPFAPGSTKIGSRNHSRQNSRQGSPAVPFRQVISVTAADIRNTPSLSVRQMQPVVNNGEVDLSQNNTHLNEMQVPETREGLSAATPSPSVLKRRVAGNGKQMDSFALITIPTSALPVVSK